MKVVEESGWAVEGGLRERFPGFFPPDEEQVREFITGGLVAFDTNALFDVYRFNEGARAEYLAALCLLAGRLWIPHRVGQELLERRLSVIRECVCVTQGLEKDLGKAFDGVTQILRAFGNRRGLSREQVRELEDVATRARDAMARRAAESYTFVLELDESVNGDPILERLETILDGKVGPPLPDPQAAEREARRRLEQRIPPGYSDGKKDPDRSVGDYLIWRQLLEKAKATGRPVVLVTNDQKQDWVREDQGKRIGARPELVAEMRAESGVPFLLISVQSFLNHARTHLGAAISETTVRQASHLKETPENGAEIAEDEISAVELQMAWRLWNADYGDDGATLSSMERIQHIVDMLRTSSKVDRAALVKFGELRGISAVKAEERERFAELAELLNRRRRTPADPPAAGG